MFSASGALARWIALVLTVAAVVGAGLLATPVPLGLSPVRLVSDADPFAGIPLYVNPASAAMRAAQQASPPSPELTAIANTPQAYWIVPGSSASTVAKYTGDAQAAGAIPVLTVYGIPHRDCGSFAAGGFATADGYRSWIDGIAADVGAARAAIILEPDALAMADPEVAAILAPPGEAPLHATPEEFARIGTAEQALWGPLALAAARGQNTRP